MTNWERLPNESPKAFQRFCCYRDMGPNRSLRTLANDLELNLSTLAELSKKYIWQSRVAAFDAFIEKASQHNQLAQIRTMKRRQIALALRAQKAASRGLKKLIREIELDAGCRLKPEGLSKLLDIGCRVERLNRDEPERSLEIKHGQNFERLEEEELETMRRLVAKAEGKS